MSIKEVVSRLTAADIRLTGFINSKQHIADEDQLAKYKGMLRALISAIESDIGVIEDASITTATVFGGITASCMLRGYDQAKLRRLGDCLRSYGEIDFRTSCGRTVFECTIPRVFSIRRPDSMPKARA